MLENVGRCWKMSEDVGRWIAYDTLTWGTSGIKQRNGVTPSGWLGRTPRLARPTSALQYAETTLPGCWGFPGGFVAWSKYDWLVTGTRLDYPKLGNCHITMERSTMLWMGKSTISMAMFNGYVSLPFGWWFFHIFWESMSSSQLTNSYIFQRGRSTTNQDECFSMVFPMSVCGDVSGCSRCFFPKMMHHDATLYGKTGGNNHPQIWSRFSSHLGC